MVDEYPASEWTPDQWLSAWTINVGKVYACAECGKMIIVTRGGVGVLDPSCCGKPMEPMNPPGSA